METDTPRYSFWKTEDIENHAREAALEGDIETLSYCLDALSPKYRTDTLTLWLNIIEYGKQMCIQPVEWLAKAAEITGRFNPQTTGNHYLYIILLSELHGKNPGYGLYVGESSKAPEIRFQEHSQGRRNRRGPLFSRIVRRHHKCLLPTLYEHLNPLSRQEAKKLEVKIARALKDAGIPVYGGQ
ncbi:MAG: hypothetical protein PVG61_05370 [Dehalococcoidia bacterium]|jgi:hypothetical protein